MCYTKLFPQYRNDAQLWAGIQLNKDLPKRFSISAQYQARFDNGILHFKAMYVYASVDYELVKKYLSAGIEYRYSTSNKRDLHRFGFSVTGKYKYKKIAFSGRVVYQREHEYFSTSYENGHEPTNYIRTRFQIKWDFKKRWCAYISFEPFIRISNKFNNIDRVRNTAGLDWEFVKTHHVNLFYNFQPDINQKTPEMAHIIGLNYTWDIPDFNKKKKKNGKK